MEILAYLKKQPKWNLLVDENNHISTGFQGNIYSKSHSIDVPIFRATVRYHSWYQGKHTTVLLFAGLSQDSFIDILKGKGPTRYDVQLEEGIDIFKIQSRIQTPVWHDPYYFHPNGWVTTIFTFKKCGRRVYLTPYTKDITKENLVVPIEDVMPSEDYYNNIVLD